MLCTVQFKDFCTHKEHLSLEEGCLQYVQMFGTSSLHPSVLSIAWGCTPSSTQNAA